MPTRRLASIEIGNEKDSLTLTSRKVKIQTLTSATTCDLSLAPFEQSDLISFGHDTKRIGKQDIFDFEAFTGASPESEIPLDTEDIFDDDNEVEN